MMRRMPTEPKTRRVRKSELGWASALGLGAMVLGALALMVPLRAGMAITVFLGFIFLLYGLFHLLYAFFTRQVGVGWFVLQVWLSILYLSAGGLIWKSPWEGLTILTLMAGVLIFLDGVIQVINAFELKPRSGWGWGLLSGLIGIFLGILIWSNWPGNSVWVLGILVGVNLITNGWAIWMISWGLRRAIVEDWPSSPSSLNEG